MTIEAAIGILFLAGIWYKCINRVIEASTRERRRDTKRHRRKGDRRGVGVEERRSCIEG